MRPFNTKIKQTKHSNELFWIRKRFIALFLVVMVIAQSIPQMVTAADKVVNLEVIVDKTNVLVGESFTYTIKYSYSSNNVNFNNEKITATLPVGMQIVSVEGSADVDSITPANPAGQTSVDFVMKQNIAAGTTGYMTVTAIYPIGSLAAATSGTLTVVGGNGTDTLAEPTEPTVNVILSNNFSWSIDKARTSPSTSINPIVGSQVTYRLRLTGNSGVGGFNIHDVVMTDTLPPEAVFVSSNPVATSVNGQILTWDMGTLTAAQTKDVTVTVNYPSTNVIVNQTVRNNVSVSGNKVQGDVNTSNTITDFVDVTFSAPNPGLNTGVKKYSRSYDANDAATADEYSIAQTIQYSIRSIGNTGNIPLDKITAYDLVPASIDLKTATTQGGTLYYTLLDRGTILNDYKNIGEGNWVAWDGTSAVGGEITALRWVFTNVGVGTTIGNLDVTAAFKGGTVANKDTAYMNAVSVDAYAEDYNGIDLDPGTDDPALLNYDTRTNGGTVTDVAYVKCVGDLPWLTVTKGASPTAVYEGDRVTYTLTLSNNSNATGSFTAADTLVITDTLPLLSGNPIFTNMQVPAKAGLTTTINGGGYGGGDASSAVFSITGVTLNPGDSFVITYTVDVKENVRVGTYTNTAVGILTDADVGVKVGNRTNDLTDSKSIQVRFKGSLKSVKGIGYNLFSDTDHTQYLLTDPTNGNAVIVENSAGQILTQNVANASTPVTPGASFYKTASGNFAMPMGTAIVNATVAGGVVRYRLEVSNDDANGPIANVVLIDKLPKLNDTGIVVNSARGSGWSPYMISAVTGMDNATIASMINDNDKYDISDIKVFYSTKASPDLSQLSTPTNRYAGDHGNGDWTTTLPENITDITYIKIQIDGSFEPGAASAVFEWDMRVPYDAPANQIAWNSFAYGATYLNAVGAQEAFLPAEPIKVGIRLEPYTITQPVHGRIGNFVWEDMNKDGVQDPSEVGLNNVVVKLYKDSNGDNVIDATELNALPFDQTVTGNNQAGAPGYYVFPNLGADQYMIELDMPNLGGKQYFMTTADAGGDDATDSDFTFGSGVKYRSGLINFDPTITAENLTFDAGIYRKGQIGNYVWNDADQDGIQDAGETGINGVHVSLKRTSDNVEVANTTTANNASGGGKDGEYVFTEVDPGNYYIEFSNYKENGNDVYAVSTINATTDDSDSDAVTIDVLSSKITNVILTSDETDLTFDVGLHKGALGDQVWLDVDADGVKEAGDNGISGITVNLYKDAGAGYGAIVATTTTNDSGNYYFYNLDPAKYKVEVQRGSYDAFTLKNNAAYKDDLDSDGEYALKTDAAATITNIVLGIGEFDKSNDVGLYKFAKIGDKVWNDKNHDGQQNTDFGGVAEPGINGVTVTLTGTTKAGAPVSLSQVTSTLSGVVGSYLFNTLDPGDYTVTFPSINGYARTVSNSGNDSTDSDASTVVGVNEGKTGAYSVTSGGSNLTVDAGYFKARIGNYVWIDTNGDGLQNEAAANGLNGITVELYQNDTNNKIDTTTTKSVGGATGYYYFENLDAGNYYVKVVESGNYHRTLQTQGADTDIDSNVDQATGFSSLITLTDGQENYSIDAGLYSYATIGDYVWVDKDYDGVQDNDEVGVNGVTVTLLHADNTTVLDGTGAPCVTTTATHNGTDGYYQFASVVPIPTNDYKIRITLPAGYDGFTVKDTGANLNGADGTDSDVNPVNGVGFGETALFKVSTGESNQTFDAGIFKYASIGNFIYYDDNQDGRHTTDGDTPEGVVPGVILELYKKDSGNNYMKETVIYKKNGNNFDLVAGTQVTTGADGRYSFDKLLPGDYKVKIVSIPLLGSSHYLATVQDVLGADQAENIDVNDSDFSEIGTTYTYDSNVYTLESGEDEDDVDAGIYLENSVGDLVYRDVDMDGQQDGGDEVGIQGITVTLYKEAGVLDTLMGTTVTDVNGNYLFSHLYKGDYYILLSNVGDNLVTPQNSVSAGEVADSDINTATLTSDQVTLTRNSNIRTLDAGLFKVVSVGDYTWLDYNGNGIQDVYVDVNGNHQDDGASEHLEQAIKGITVSIKNGSGNAINNSLGQAVPASPTNALGNYLFSSLLPGTYKIIFDTHSIDYNENTFLVQNKPLILTTLHATLGTVESDSDGAIYNDDSSMSVIANIVLGDSTSLRDRRDLDAGFYQLGSIGDKVWNDTDLDGIQDDNELPVKELKLTLYDAQEVKVAETQTDVDGKYLFNNLKPGVYSIKLTLSADYYVTYDHRGGDVAKDSDFDNVTLKATNIILYSGGQITTVDAGIYYAPKPANCEIGDYIWVDADQDTIQDASEKGLVGIGVILYDISGAKIRTTTTDANGYYIFKGLLPGTYTVEVDKNSVLNYVQTYDVDMNLDHRASVYVVAAAKILSLDFGYVLNQPKLTLQKIANKETIAEGETVTFTITVTNSGNIPLNHVVVSDFLLGMTKEIGTLQVGETITIVGTYIASKEEVITGSFTNIASADCDETQPVSDDVTVKVTKKVVDKPTVEKPVITPEEPKAPVIKDITPDPLPGGGDKPTEHIYAVDKKVDKVIITQEPEHGSVTIDANNQIIFIPDETFTGTDKIVVTVTIDGKEMTYEIEIQDDVVAGALITELPQTGGVPISVYYLFGGFFVTIGSLLRRRNQ